ncbi:MFS transporter [Gilvibacter sediminis]|uniref:MFS transporter n=1 Tax=Gilvibacter sediminis TaxID=379071 RepID=UPI00235060C7|nr:MFS transporter [Gilvibacter sediminis]MDC7998949.1 MFS transporter [Gilvibacter sediminis]
MDRIHSQKHSLESFWYVLSRMLERSSFYGLRAILVLYMVDEATLALDQSEAFSFYGLFISVFVFSQILGALLGDFVLGNKKTVIVGGVLQALGAFCLCFPSMAGLYAGMVLVVLGGGLYTPNLIANFGKSYLNRLKLLDSGFTLLYLAVNLGSFLGILALGILADSQGYAIAFGLSGMLALMAIVPIVLTKEPDLNALKKPSFSLNRRILNILIAFIVVGAFWGLYELSSLCFYDIQAQFGDMEGLGLGHSEWQSMSTYILLPLTFLAVLAWSYFYTSQLFKMALGFIFGVLAFVVFLQIPQVATEQHGILFIVSLILLGLAEVFTAPVVHSVLTQYTNPKYLAIMISLSFLPTRMVSSAFALLNDLIYDEPILGVQLALGGMSLMALLLVGTFVIKRFVKIN